MAYCKNCGKEVTNDYAECPNCGFRNNDGYYNRMHGTTATKTEPMAIASLVMGILALVSYYGGILFGILAIVFAHMANNKIESSNYLQGSGMAKAGKIMGIIGLAIWGALIFFVIGIASCASVLF